MIRKHQPTIFNETGIIVAVSSTADGNMKFGLESDTVTLGNRQQFLGEMGISADDATLVKVTYDADDFRRYRIAGDTEKGLDLTRSSDTRPADALAVDYPGHALFLPLADCVAAVLYDPEHRVLMMSHLGRHSTEADGGHKSIDYMIDHYATAPSNLLVWLSPAAGKATYPLTHFSGRSMHEVITDQLRSAGVNPANIEISPVDTANDPHYFSHSQFLRDASQPNGRFAVVAMMTAQGEPAS